MVERGPRCDAAFLEPGSGKIGRGSCRLHSGNITQHYNDASPVSVNAGNPAASGLSLAQAGALPGRSRKGEDQCSCDFAVLLESLINDDITEYIHGLVRECGRK